MPDDRPPRHHCDRCGRPATVLSGDDWFCDECSQLPGSCCPEFGADDLWTRPTPEPEEAASDEDSDRDPG
ncbi:MAG: hypothetical protein EA425_08490 [Puniceicoccaceae bacterium]|nr:MAG: hypothetical protein EA425_08490 [Puniceicoccaceae bacterium]